MFELPGAPQPIGKVLDTAFRLFRACFKAVLPLAALYALISQLPSIIVSGFVGTTPENVGGSMVGLFGIVVLVCVIVSIALYVALVHAVDDIAHGRAQSIRSSISYGFRKTPAAIGAGLLSALAIMVGLILLIVPGIILMVTLLLAFATIATEDSGPIEALRRSHRLVWGDWWRTLAEVTVIGLIVVIPFILVGLVIGGLAGAAGSVTGASLGMDIATIVVTALLTPLWAAGYLAIFYDRRLRKEGGDLEARVSAQA